MGAQHVTSSSLRGAPPLYGFMVRLSMGLSACSLDAHRVTCQLEPVFSHETDLEAGWRSALGRQL